MAKKKSADSSKNAMIIGSLGVLVIIIVIVALIVGGHDYSQFAGCLSEKGVVMAGAEWCSHCKNQKSLFRGAFEEVMIPAGAYKDCDIDPQWCQEQGVEGYPTWVLPDGGRLVGVQQLNTLSKVTGCPIE